MIDSILTHFPKHEHFGGPTAELYILLFYNNMLIQHSYVKSVVIKPKISICVKCCICVDVQDFSFKGYNDN